MSILSRLKAKHEIKDLFKKTKPLIEEILDENDNFRLRDTNNKRKVLFYDMMFILCMLFILCTIGMLFFGLLFDYFTDGFIQFIMFIDLLLFILIGWCYREECRQ
jgi:hypothetical protein